MLPPPSASSIITSGHVCTASSATSRMSIIGPLQVVTVSMTPSSMATVIASSERPSRRAATATVTRGS